MDIARELQAEQEHVDRAYARLDRLRDEASDLAGDVVATGRGGSVADRIDRNARVALALARRAAASIGNRSLCFGRIDTEEGDRLHIGRLGVSDEEGDPLMVDWRAPVAESFYRATSADRRGLVQRRHIRMRGRQVVGVDDDLLGDDASGLVGEGALLAALSEARTGRMGDIVGTIQAEQDSAIRAPMRGALVVQGGPGTGKTAVALHRAAYLLYAHQFPLAEHGVLVVGPNPIFCRYVEDVLPGLGETGVRLSTPAELSDLAPTDRPPSSDRPEEAAVKADIAMVDRLAAVVAGHRRPLESVARVGLAIHRLPVTPGDSARMVARAASEPTYRAGRARLEGMLLRHLARRVAQADERATRSGLERPAADPARVVEELKRSAEVRALADSMWPPLTPEGVVTEALAEVGLTPAETWSEHDLALLDEAAFLLGPPVRSGRRRSRRRPVGPVMDETLERTLSYMEMLPACPACESELSWVDGRFECPQPRCQKTWRASQVMSPEAFQQLREVAERVSGTHRRPGPDGPPIDTFGHVIVDEAQDITPMQWRMLARRCPTGSMTLVGDLGQAKHPWSARSWSEVCSVAAPDVPHRVVELSVNYRTPEEVMRLARAALGVAAPDLRAPAAVRSTGEEPVCVSTDSGRMADEVRAAAELEAAAVSPGRVAVVHPAGALDVVDARILDAQVANVDVERAKGLEFDSVVVVEPAAHSPSELYVALTRTTRRLVLVHSDPLPDYLGEEVSAS
ncbi:MAG TPA: UvrD-helicase domain-containing protein [Acidimicrobiales bacterium]|nr:UvrD-helicase domain-containing protein [Acidimicrobiales bacterium]